MALREREPGRIGPILSAGAPVGHLNDVARREASLRLVSVGDAVHQAVDPAAAIEEAVVGMDVKVDEIFVDGRHADFKQAARRSCARPTRWRRPGRRDLRFEI